MRELRTVQHSIFERYAEHEIGKELKAMSAWLDGHRVVLDWVAADLWEVGIGQRQAGRASLPNRYCGARCSSNIASSVTMIWRFVCSIRCRAKPLLV